MRNLTGNIDRWQIIRFQPPSSVSIDARGFPAGTEDADKGLCWFSINSITPIDERSCNYYWTITRCFAQDDQEITDLVHKQIPATFLEDKEVLEAQQRLIETDDRAECTPPMECICRDLGRLIRFRQERVFTGLLL